MNFFDSVAEFIGKERASYSKYITEANEKLRIERQQQITKTKKHVLLNNYDVYADALKEAINNLADTGNEAGNHRDNLDFKHVVNISQISREIQIAQRQDGRLALLFRARIYPEARAAKELRQDIQKEMNIICNNRCITRVEIVARKSADTQLDIGEVFPLDSFESNYLIAQTARLILSDFLVLNGFKVDNDWNMNDKNCFCLNGPQVFISVSGRTEYSTILDINLLRANFIAYVQWCNSNSPVQFAPHNLAICERGNGVSMFVVLSHCRTNLPVISTRGR